MRYHYDELPIFMAIFYSILIIWAMFGSPFASLILCHRGLYLYNLKTR